MSKVRVYDLARELKVPNKDLLELLKDLGVDARSHSSTIDEADAQAVRELYEAEAEEQRRGARQAKRTRREREGEPRRPKAAPPAEEKAEEEKEAEERWEKPKKKKKREAEAPPPAVPEPEVPPPPLPPPEPEENIIEIEESISIRDLAQRLGIELSDILATLAASGLMGAISQRIDADQAILVAEQYGFKARLRQPEPEPAPPPPPEPQEKPKGTVPIAPVVTVLGHVDHGKTTLLDTIRHANVVATEAGGITQHIGAYEVVLDGHKITFLDTPGHEAFTEMRARGAKGADIAVLVVAADDGVMPQTVEAINHAKAAGVPIIVAINKIDREGANIERVKRQLMEYGLVAEEWGGDTICVPISALHNEGVDHLLEMILLVAEMEDLRGDPQAQAEGTVIEAKLDKGRGPVATVLVRDGTLRQGQTVVIGDVYGRIRTMLDYQGQPLEAAGPATPVEILGLSGVPNVGQAIEVVPNERVARQLAGERSLAQREERLAGSGPAHVSLESLFDRIQRGALKELKVIVKADVQGSVEALCQSLRRLDNEEVRIHILHSAVGSITESDVKLAAASDAVILGFNTTIAPSDQKLAEEEGIEVRLYKVIYEAINDVKAAMIGLLEPEYEEVPLGHAEVLQLFKVSRLGTIAGCRVLEGRLQRGAHLRIARNRQVIHETELTSLRRFEEPVEEVPMGLECGVALETFNDFQAGDILEAYLLREVPRELPI